MADIDLVIKIDEKLVEWVDGYSEFIRGFHGEKIGIIVDAIKNGTPLPKGHGRLIDADVLADGFEDNYEFCEEVNATPTIIPADKEEQAKDKKYKSEVITRGNCMICGEKLTEGLFLCEECGEKANKESEE